MVVALVNGASPLVICVHTMMEYVKRPIRAVTAPAAQRAYLSTLLFLAASLVLLVVAALAYPVFYYSYVPKKLVSLPVHLQYKYAAVPLPPSHPRRTPWRLLTSSPPPCAACSVGLNPYGLASVSKGLMLETAYDVSVELTLPRSPPNTERGNFMVALFATKSAIDNPAQSWTVPQDPYDHIRADNVVFSSRRPALVPYEDPLVSYASRVLFLLYHVAVAASERIQLSIPMGELVEFRDQLPLSLLLDVQGGQTLQVYSARILLIARLTGVRWFMYNHRLLSFMVGTTLFWFAEMLSMGTAWAFLSFCLKRTKTLREDAAAVHRRPLEGNREATTGDLSSTKGDEGGRQFATESEPQIKSEDTDDSFEREFKEESVGRRSSDSLGRAGYADDEEDGEGTATNYASARGLRRRSSQPKV